MDTHKLDRREFLTSVVYGAAALSALGMGPLRAIAQTAGAPRAGSPSGKRLLILNLAGGFDPLFVLQPDVGALADVRPKLFQAPNTLLPFTGQLGLTPSFPLFGELFQKGEALVVHRVGLRNSTREHQNSERTNARGTFDRLAAADKGGWVQRVADTHPDSFKRPTDVMDFANGNSTVSGGKFSAASVNASLQTFAPGSLGEVAVLRDAKVYELDSVSTKSALALQGAQGTLTAFELSDSLAKAVSEENKSRMALAAKGTPLMAYPDSRLGNTVKSVETAFSQLGSQVAYVRTDGFDTHNNQKDRIAQLFGGLNATLGAFRNNMIARGMWNDTIILTTTDFGREFKDNSSNGTDHGVGADTYLIGPSVAGRRIIGADYTAADFMGKRFLDSTMNVQNILREVVGALGYEPESVFARFDGQEKLGLFNQS